MLKKWNYHDRWYTCICSGHKTNEAKKWGQFACTSCPIVKSYVQIGVNINLLSALENQAKRWVPLIQRLWMVAHNLNLALEVFLSWSLYIILAASLFCILCLPSYISDCHPCNSTYSLIISSALSTRNTILLFVASFINVCYWFSLGVFIFGCLYGYHPFSLFIISIFFFCYIVRPCTFYLVIPLLIY